MDINIFVELELTLTNMEIPVKIVAKSPLELRATNRTINAMGAMVHGTTGKVHEVHQYHADGTMKVIYQDPVYKKLKDSLSVV